MHTRTAPDPRTIAAFVLLLFLPALAGCLPVTTEHFTLGDGEIGSKTLLDESALRCSIEIDPELANVDVHVVIDRFAVTELSVKDLDVRLHRHDGTKTPIPFKSIYAWRYDPYKTNRSADARRFADLPPVLKTLDSITPSSDANYVWHFRDEERSELLTIEVKMAIEADGRRFRIVRTIPVRRGSKTRIDWIFRGH